MLVNTLMEVIVVAFLCHQFSSVQYSRSVVPDSLRPHESQHTRPPCPSPTPGVHSESRPSSQYEDSIKSLGNWVLIKHEQKGLGKVLANNEGFKT